VCLVAPSELCRPTTVVETVRVGDGRVVEMQVDEEGPMLDASADTRLSHFGSSPPVTAPPARELQPPLRPGQVVAIGPSPQDAGACPG